MQYKLSINTNKTFQQNKLIHKLRLKVVTSCSPSGERPSLDMRSSGGRLAPSGIAQVDSDLMLEERDDEHDGDAGADADALQEQRAAPRRRTGARLLRQLGHLRANRTIIFLCIACQHDTQHAYTINQNFTHTHVHTLKAHTRKQGTPFCVPKRVIFQSPSFVNGSLSCDVRLAKLTMSTSAM